MAWILLIAGLAIWCGAHWLKRLAPGVRAKLGDERGKGMIAITLFASIVLMVLGYRWTPFIDVWQPPSFFNHINNLLVLVAFYMMSPAPKKGRLFTGLRHPMLLGFGLWAGAHLLANGDLTAIITFGVLTLWAVISARLVNAAEPNWTPREKGEWKWDGMGIAGAIVLTGVIGLIHGWLGPWPFG